MSLCKALFSGDGGVAQLRAQIGNPTADPSAIGFISDESLQGIIDDYCTSLQQIADSRLEVYIRERLERNQPLVQSRYLDEVRIPLADSSEVYGTKWGVIPEPYLPYIMSAVGYYSGENPQPVALSHDPFIETTIGATRNGRSRRRFAVRGRHIYVSPTALDHVTVWMTDRDRLLDDLGGEESLVAELIPQYRALIIKEALQMLASTVQEGTRMENQGDI